MALTEDFSVGTDRQHKNRQYSASNGVVCDTVSLPRLVSALCYRCLAHLMLLVALAILPISPGAHLRQAGWSVESKVISPSVARR